MIELYEPQKLAVAHMATALQSHPATLNASGTGTGKTIMGLQLAAELGLEPLIVCPLAARATWFQWAQEQDVAVLDIVNSEKLRTGKTPWASLKPGRPPTFLWNLDPGKHMVLWDEVHRGLTGKDSITGRLGAMLRPQGIKTVLMSATPFSSPLDLRHTGYLLGLHNWSTASFFSFCRGHGCTNSPFHRGLAFNPESRAAKAHLERINQKIKDRTVKLTTADIAFAFPEGNIIEPCLIQLNDRDTSEAQRIYAEMEEAVKQKNHSNPMIDMLRARQRCELLKVPAMADMIEDSLNEGLSVFVSLSFCDTVTKLDEELRQQKKLDMSVTLTGSDNETRRNAAVSLFNQDLARVLIASPAGGESISLHCRTEGQRSRTSLISPNYSASGLRQALGRIERAGMLYPVVQRVVLCAGTIEERVARRLQAKVQAIDTLTDSDLQ